MVDSLAKENTTKQNNTPCRGENREGANFQAIDDVSKLSLCLCLLPMDTAAWIVSIGVAIMERASGADSFHASCGRSKEKSGEQGPGLLNGICIRYLVVSALRAPG
jgi:hypothetical protein